MYYQVKVLESKISYLRYLWWKEDDINSDIVGHEKCAHLFEALSSPSVSNNTLKKTAVDTVVLIL